MSEQAATELTPAPWPAAWCREILEALQRQKVDDREAGHLQMLLAAFLEIDPTPAVFEERLVAYTADSRPDIANAAAVLLAAWRRRNRPTCAPLCLGDRLRVLGALLDELGAHAAYLEIDDHGARFEAWTPARHARSLSAHELHERNAAFSNAPGSVSASAPDRATRYEQRLRQFGHTLDAAEGQTYWLVVTRGLIEVEGSRGHVQTIYGPDTATLQSVVAA